MKDKITFDAFYPHSPERVWEALTDPKALAQWLMPSDFKPELGYRFKLEGLQRGGNSTVRGEVIEVEQGKRLSYTWDDGEDDSPGVVSWTLKPKDGGTELRLEHKTAAAAMSYVLIEADMNWRYAMYASLPVLLALLRHKGLSRPVPITYVLEEPVSEEEKPQRRAGFRQEVETCA